MQLIVGRFTIFGIGYNGNDVDDDNVDDDDDNVDDDDVDDDDDDNDHNDNAVNVVNIIEPDELVQHFKITSWTT